MRMLCQLNKELCGAFVAGFCPKALIPHIVFLKPICKCQFPHKFLNLFFILVIFFMLLIIKDKLTDL